MAKFRIVHDKQGCIGCGACAATCPDFWEMDSDEPRSKLKGAASLDDGRTELRIEEEDFECNMQAAEGCPVNVIHIIDVTTGEKRI